MVVGEFWPKGWGAGVRFKNEGPIRFYLAKPKEKEPALLAGFYFGPTRFLGSANGCAASCAHFAFFGRGGIAFAGGPLRSHAGGDAGTSGSGHLSATRTTGGTTDGPAGSSGTGGKAVKLGLEGFDLFTDGDSLFKLCHREGADMGSHAALV